MRSILAASLSAGVAVVVTSPATAAAPPPTVPSDAAIAQYVEAIPSATGPAPVGGPAGKASALPPSVRTKVERTAGADAPALLAIAQDPRFGVRPAPRREAAPVETARKTPPRRHVQHPSTHAVPQQPALSSGTPSVFSAAASTAGSGELLLVAFLLIAITGAGMAATVRRR